MATLNTYRTDVLNVFPCSLKQGKLYFGIELEFSYISALEELEEPYRAIFKSDSSIGYEGAELVSVPLAYEELAPWLAAQNFTGFKVSERCGMHVHLSRAALSERQIAIILALIEDDYLYHRIRDEAGRDFASNGYSKKSKDCEEKESRYKAVNLQNRRTIEVRIFAGTTCKETILARLEWLNTLVAYAGSQGAVPSYGAFLLWKGEWSKEEYNNMLDMIDKLNKEAEDKRKKEERRKQREAWLHQMSLVVSDWAPTVAVVLLVVYMGFLFSLPRSGALFTPEVQPPSIEEVEDLQR